MKKERNESAADKRNKSRVIVYRGRAEKELLELIKAVPKHRAKQVLTCIEYVAAGQPPSLSVGHLAVSGGHSAIEIILNGSPALRVVYTLKDDGKMTILYAGKKTSQGTDRKLIETVEARLKM